LGGAGAALRGGGAVPGRAVETGLGPPKRSSIPPPPPREEEESAGAPKRSSSVKCGRFAATTGPWGLK